VADFAVAALEQRWAYAFLSGSVPQLNDLRSSVGACLMPRRTMMHQRGVELLQVYVGNFGSVRCVGQERALYVTRCALMPLFDLCDYYYTIPKLIDAALFIHTSDARSRYSPDRPVSLNFFAQQPCPTCPLHLQPRLIKEVVRERREGLKFQLDQEHAILVVISRPALAGSRLCPRCPHFGKRKKARCQMRRRSFRRALSRSMFRQTCH